MIQLIKTLDVLPVGSTPQALAGHSLGTFRCPLPSGEVCVLSDTVGFSSDLPVDLVAAFKSTLEEVVDAGQQIPGVTLQHQFGIKCWAGLP